MTLVANVVDLDKDADNLEKASDNQADNQSENNN